SKLADAHPGFRGRVVERRLRGHERLDRRGARQVAEHRSVTGRIEGLPAGDESSRGVGGPTTERVDPADEDPDRETRDRDPPARAKGVEPAPQVDLALRLEIGGRPVNTHESATLDDAHSHWARRPSSSETDGSHPSSRRILVVSALVRRWSPATAGR